MSKLLAVLMCVLISFCYVGCGKTNNEKQNKEAKAALTDVLNEKGTFIVKNMQSNKTTEETLEKYHFSTVSNAYYAFVPGHYTFVDLDADGIQELIVFDLQLSYYLVLRYANEKVYGYNIESRNMVDLKTDGSFKTTSISAGDKFISRISFADTSFEITDKAYKNDDDGKYLIKGESTDKGAVEKYFEEWNKNTTKVSWEKID